MSEKQKFIILYLDDYVRMAYRQLTKKVDLDKERQLTTYIYYLLDEYPEGRLNKYIQEEKIV